VSSAGDAAKRLRALEELKTQGKQVIVIYGVGDSSTTYVFPNVVDMLVWEKVHNETVELKTVIDDDHFINEGSDFKDVVDYINSLPEGTYCGV
jgi:hypothetical protein